jgi:NADH
VLGQYLPLVFLFALAFLFAALSFFASRLLAPRSPNDKKAAPYECGIIPGREAPERFPVRFFLVAMIFIVFDIEIIFFYPRAI